MALFKSNQEAHATITGVASENVTFTGMSAVLNFINQDYFISFSLLQVGEKFSVNEKENRRLVLTTPPPKAPPRRKTKGQGQVAPEDKTVYLCQKSVITMKNQVRPVCSPKDKIWSRTDKLQRCRRLPLEQAKLGQILENNSEGVLI